MKRPDRTRRVRRVARDVLARWPSIERHVQRASRESKWAVSQCRWALAARTMDGDRFLDIQRLLRVPPKTVARCSLIEISPETGLGRAMPGDWDRGDKLFRDLDIAVAVRQVYSEGASWEDTVFYRRLVGAAEAGREWWGVTDRAGADARCAAIDRLYESMRVHGYLDTRSYEGDAVHSVPPLDEIAVVIGRDGRLLFANSAHRLAIAQLLDLPSVPVVVAARHPGWMAFRRQVEQAVASYGGLAYQPPIHPDLETVPAHHDCESRLHMIIAALETRQGTLLDIGANWGFFCHRLEDLGFDCIAVEDFPEAVHFLRKLRDASDRRFDIVARSVLEPDVTRGRDYSVVLALNIFHHFLKTEAAFVRFRSMLRGLNTRELYFEPHLDGELQMRDAARQMTSKAFAEFVAEQTGLRDVQLLGHSPDGRPLYRMSSGQ